MRLIPFPGPPAPPLSMSASLIWHKPSEATIRYHLLGALDELYLPPRARPERADELWRTTCFELFVRGEETDYAEFNFSPSTAWAAYSFDAYREGMRPARPTREPTVSVIRHPADLIVDVLLAAPDLQTATAANLSAVIETKSGQLSYWALAHPADKPDFHDPACFIATLPAPKRP